MNQNRQKKIIQTSIIGIITNIALAIFKAIVGLISGSIAITLDAVNNLSDALSSLITIIGTKLAGKEPDICWHYFSTRIHQKNCAFGNRDLFHCDFAHYFCGHHCKDCFGIVC